MAGLLWRLLRGNWTNLGRKFSRGLFRRMDRLVSWGVMCRHWGSWYPRWRRKWTTLMPAKEYYPNFLWWWCASAILWREMLRLRFLHASMWSWQALKKIPMKVSGSGAVDKRVCLWVKPSNPDATMSRNSLMFINIKSDLNKFLWQCLRSPTWLDYPELDSKTCMLAKTSTHLSQYQHQL